MPRDTLSRCLAVTVCWVRRAGPVRSLVVVLGSLTLTLLGCYALTERGAWRRPSGSDRPPQVSIGRMVRVRLLSGARPTAKLQITCPYEILAAANNRLLRAKGVALSASTVRLARDGGIDLGNTHLTQSDILLIPQRDACLVVNGRTYRGLLRIGRVDGGMAFTNHVDVESYLRGVLRGELPKNFHPESFKAQCVAARTYVLYQMRITPKDKSFDVYDNEGSQMYLGVRGEDPKADAAVEKTRGQVCVWNDRGTDRLFCTYYASACGGMSQHVTNVKPNDPDVPPLRGGVVCNDCYLSKFYRWGPVRISKQELTKRIVARYPSTVSLGTIVGLRPKELTSDGRIVRIQLDGSTGRNETLIGEDFRLSVGGHVLKSTDFVIETEPDAFVFRNGKGFGHGVGLCQNGMETKARRGMDYKRILAIYYPTSKVKTLYQ